MSSPATELSHRQQAAIFDEAMRGRYAMEWLLARLDGKTSMPVLGVEVSTDEVREALVTSFAIALPEYVDDFVGIKRHGFGRPEGELALDRLAAEFSVVAEAYITSATDTNPALLREIVDGTRKRESLLTEPPRDLVDSFRYFNQIAPVLERVRIRIPDAFCKDHVALGQLPNGWQAQLVARRTLREDRFVVDDFRARSVRVALEPVVSANYIADIERQLQEMTSSNISHRIDDGWMKRAADLIDVERRKIGDALEGKFMTNPPMVLASGSYVGGQIFSASRALEKAAGSRPVSSAIKVAGATVVLMTGAGGVAWLIPAAAGGSLSVAAVVTMGVLTKGLHDQVRAAQMMRDLPETRKERKLQRQIDELGPALRAEQDLLNTADRQLAELSHVIGDAYAMQCRADDLRLDSLELPADSVATAMDRRLALGRAPDPSSAQWRTYVDDVVKYARDDQSLTRAVRMGEVRQQSIERGVDLVKGAIEPDAGLTM